VAKAVFSIVRSGLPSRRSIKVSDPLHEYSPHNGIYRAVGLISAPVGKYRFHPHPRGSATHPLCYTRSGRRVGFPARLEAGLPGLSKSQPEQVYVTANRPACRLAVLLSTLPVAHASRQNISEYSLSSEFAGNGYPKCWYPSPEPWCEDAYEV